MSRRGVAAWLLVLLLMPAALIVLYAYRQFFAGSEASAPEAAVEVSRASIKRLAGFPGDSGAALLDISPAGSPVVGWGGNLVDGASGAALLNAARADLSGMAVTRQGLVTAAAGSWLLYLRDGGLQASLKLPGPGMRVERVGERLCVYGPLPADEAPVMAGGKPTAPERHWGVYLLDPSGRHAKLFTFPSEISALSETEDGLVFASGGSIYRLAFGRKVAPVLYLPAQPAITAVAWSPERRALAFSTETGVYLLVAGRVAKLLEGPGALRWASDGLLVLSRARRELLKIQGL